MNLQPQLSFDGERTKEIPAQEQGVIVRERLVVLSAEEVYAQRLAQNPLNGDAPGPIFVP